MDVFRSYCGPIHKAFGALDAVGQGLCYEYFMALIGRMNRTTGGTLAVPSEYLEVVVVKG